MVAYIPATHGADDCSDRAGTQPNRRGAAAMPSRARDGGVIAVLLGLTQGRELLKQRWPRLDHRRSRGIRVTGFAAPKLGTRDQGLEVVRRISSIGTSVVPY